MTRVKNHKVCEAERESRNFRRSRKDGASETCTIRETELVKRGTSNVPTEEQ